MDYSSETSLCTVAPSPTDTPFPIFFWGEGAAVHRLSEMDNPSSNCPSKLMDKVRRIVHSKLKLFHFQIKTYYLSDANHQTDNPSHTNNRCLVWKWPFLLRMSRLGPELGARVSDLICFFTKIIWLFLNWLLTFLCVK